MIVTGEVPVSISNMCRGVMVVATTTVGVVEALKDQGYCRLNNTMRSVAQGAKNHVRSAPKATKLSPPASTAISKKLRDEDMKKAEESLRTIMYLSTWGPNT